MYKQELKDLEMDFDGPCQARAPERCNAFMHESEMSHSLFTNRHALSQKAKKNMQGHLH